MALSFLWKNSLLNFNLSYAIPPNSIIHFELLDPIVIQENSDVDYILILFLF